jgi:hypothetical protein
MPFIINLLSGNSGEHEMTSLVETWQSIIVGDSSKSWVLFKNGTCVILVQPEDELETQAKNLLAEYGPVHVGTPSGDFSIINLRDDPGWVVTCHHNDILTYIGPDEAGNDAQDLTIGMLGRQKRDDDAHELTVIHVEDRR